MEKEISKSGKRKTGDKSVPEKPLESLTDLRNNIDDIDREILELLFKRQEEVEKVLSFKKAHSMLVYHPAREEDIITERRRQGKEMGMDPDYLEELFRTVMRRSRVVQTNSIAKQGIKPGAGVLIVGGTGGMGKYFSKWFSEAGYETRTMGSRDWPQIDKLCKGIELVVISVPINVTEDVIRKIGPYIPSECLLADLTSIKSPPVKAMLESHSGPVMGIHPLFGPSTSTMDKQIVVVTPGRNKESCRWLCDQLAAWGAVVIEAGAEEHDEIMGIVQALRHFATFAFGQFIQRRQVDLRRTLEFSSPIYRLELSMVGRLFAQDPSLYSEIIFASQDRRDLLKDYLESMNDNLKMIEKGDKEAFEKEFKKIVEWFGPFSEQAIRESGFLIDKLIERF